MVSKPEVELLLELLLNGSYDRKRHQLISKNLFVYRDPLYLKKRNGIVEPFRELPDFLGKSPLDVKINSLFYYNRFVFEGNLMPLHTSDREWNDLPEDKKHVPAYWSGFRSCVTADLSTGQLYRLKGMAVGNKPLIIDRGPDTPFMVYGGQFLRNAYNERDYSDKFNKVLADNGIEPVMEYVGLYKLPLRAKRKQLATSIIRVLGDTRLDEFFYALEYDAWYSRACAEKDYPKLRLFYKEARNFYQDIGQVVGKLKKLMDRGGLSWSDNPERTNAHIGNIVLYRVDEQNLGVGLVDFDASCDRREKSRMALLQQQQQEKTNIINSAAGHVISPRPFGNIFYQKRYCVGLRAAFGNGFIQGYISETKREISNKIGIERLSSLLEKLEGLDCLAGKRNKKNSSYFNRFSLNNRVPLKNLVQLDESICDEEQTINLFSGEIIKH